MLTTTIILEDEHPVEYIIGMEKKDGQTLVHLGPGKDLVTGEEVPTLSLERFAEFLNTLDI